MGARVRGNKEVASYTLPTKSLDTRLARRRLVCCISIDLVSMFIFPTHLRRFHVQYFCNSSLCKGSMHQSIYR